MYIHPHGGPGGDGIVPLIPRRDLALWINNGAMGQLLTDAVVAVGLGPRVVEVMFTMSTRVIRECGE